MPHASLPELTLTVTVRRDTTDPGDYWPDVEMPAGNRFIRPDRATVTYQRVEPGYWMVKSIEFEGPRFKVLKSGRPGVASRGYWTSHGVVVPDGYAGLARDTFKTLAGADPSYGKLVTPVGVDA